MVESARQLGVPPGLAETGRVDRRTFLLGLSAIAAAGCARVPPPGLASPGGSAAPSVPWVIGNGVGSDLDLLGALIGQALGAGGRNYSTVVVGEEWQASLGHGDVSLLPAFGATRWAELSKEAEPPAAADVVPELAGLLEPDVSVLEVPGVDGSLVWMVTQETAHDGITSLSRIKAWSDGKTAAVPDFVENRDDGIPGLEAVYGAEFDVEVVVEAERREALLLSGEAAIGAFRRTEYLSESGLVELVDVEKLTLADPAVVLLNTALTEAEPDQVLLIDRVVKAVTTDVLINLQAQVAEGGAPSDVALSWLKEQGLA